MNRKTLKINEAWRACLTDLTRSNKSRRTLSRLCTIERPLDNAGSKLDIFLRVLNILFIFFVTFEIRDFYIANNFRIIARIIIFPSTNEYDIFFVVSIALIFLSSLNFDLFCIL